MKIAFLSPVTLNELQPLFSNEVLPDGLPSSLFIEMLYYYIQEGHEVVVCTTDTKLNKSKIFKNGNITIFVAASIKKAKLRAALHFKFEINQMYRFLKKNPCDVYHAHWTYEFALAALKINADRTLITVHDWAPKIYELYHDFYRLQRYKMNNKVMRKGKYFSTVSDYMQDKVSSYYWDKYTRVIPNYLYLDHDKPLYKILNQEKQIIIAINNGFNRAKNATKIIEAFKIIHQEMPSTSLIMIGEGFEVNGAAHLWAKSKDLAEGINFMGKLPHDYVMSELEKADLLIHTSLEESFGMGVLESMHQKTVVVGGNKSGAIPWLLEDGKCGALVDVTNVSQIAHEAIGILQSPKRWEEYATNGLKRVNDFSIQQVANQYLDYYIEIANNSIFI